MSESLLLYYITPNNSCSSMDGIKDWLKRNRIKYAFHNNQTQSDDAEVFGQNPIGVLHQKLADVELSCRLEMMEIAALVRLAGAG